MKTKLLLLAIILAGCGEVTTTTTETLDKEGVVLSLEIRGEPSVWNDRLFCLKWIDGSLSEYPLPEFNNYKQLGINQRKIKIYKQKHVRSDLGNTSRTEYRWEYVNKNVR